MRAILRSLILVMGFMLAAQKVLGEEGIVVVDLALVDQGRSSEVQTGVAQGLTEANLLGRFTGQEYRLRKVGLEQLAASSNDLPTAVLAALPAADLERLSSSSPDLTHIVEVKAGDNLALLCHRIYKDSQYYPDVARANNLSHFSDIKPGDRLYFPPLR